MSVINERRKYFKKEAKFFLRYNYIKQIFMTGLVILLTFGLNAIKANIIRILGLEYSFYAVPLGMFFDLAAFFITLPMYAGIIYVNVKLFEGENLPVSGVFYYFASANSLLECYKFVIALFARLAVFALPFLIIGVIFPQIEPVIDYMLGDYMHAVTLDIAMLCVSLAYMLAFIICLVIFMRYFATIFIFVKNPCLSVRDIMGKSIKMMKKRKTEALKLILSFAFWIIISHFFAGFLYIFFTLPYMTLCYASFMSYLLAEKGGEEFLIAAGDYIDEFAKKNKCKKIPKAEEMAKSDAALDTSHADINKILAENTVQIDGIIDYYEIDEELEENKSFFGFLTNLEDLKNNYKTTRRKNFNEQKILYSDSDCILVETAAYRQ